MGRFYRNIAGLGDFEYFFEWEFKKECFFVLSYFQVLKMAVREFLQN